MAQKSCLYVQQIENFCQVTLKIKSNIKSWKPENYPCRQCRLYIVDIGFIEL